MTLRKIHPQSLAPGDRVLYRVANVSFLIDVVKRLASDEGYKYWCNGNGKAGSMLFTDDDRLLLVGK